MTTFLDELLADAAARVARARAHEPFAALRERAASAAAPLRLVAALRTPGVAVIAEIKRASPSKGVLAAELDAARHARAYLDGGVAAISVLTEPQRFLGSLDDLSAVSKLGAPVLRKDFLVDPYQVWEARAHGASAVLLIVAALDDPTLTRLHAEARDAGLDALVEVHDQDELARAVALDAELIGINARDLRTFDVDPGTFARLRPQIPDGIIVVAESGVTAPGDVHRAAADGADAVLIGEALVTADDPAATAAALVRAGRHHLQATT